MEESSLIAVLSDYIGGLQMSTAQRERLWRRICTTLDPPPDRGKQSEKMYKKEGTRNETGLPGA